ncbi:DNA/RNA endonuclease G, NUC1 [Algoriphagus faecimaris]|uniref:DNA/RNA endonuclease G, NUC1 n=1 Tax=Algoriphagus faecimaris TaxID=686796 RepID=A0A1G6WGI4_9BACT|nr:DNA/RNA non-specific endonuclease [Algoriphagus faecimaris]SDD64918.1 DNA/RNA endonuclease G, NUC1 [Algoriphagus faecimaris]
MKISFLHAFLLFIIILGLESCSSCSRSGLREIAESRKRTNDNLPESQKPHNNLTNQAPILLNESSSKPLSSLFQQNKDAVFLIYTSTGIDGFQGTGFFISEEGIGVSNYHVFEGTSKGLESIQLSDGKRYQISDVLYFDKDNDYIIFKVNNSQKVPALRISDHTPTVGEEVFAIGNPKGLEHTLSTGIISALRDSGEILQTTTEITHGSSGGPLMNMNGEVVGITTAGLGEANLNFAINIQSLPIESFKKKSEFESRGLNNFLPASKCNQIIHHTYFSLSYCEPHEQAEWVAYKLIPEYFSGVSRTNDYREDPKVRTGSATLEDYRNSGYDRGHLLPAGSMKHSYLAMSETFYLSNISPQRNEFNGGAWLSLEEKVRQWTRKSDSLYVVTGGVLHSRLGKIRGTNVSIPEYFYKVIVRFESNRIDGIGFIMENKELKGNIINYAVTIDKVEELTGIDFFTYFPPEIENLLESELLLSNWK